MYRIPCHVGMSHGLSGLGENASLRWICSQPVLADSLAKCMSGGVLREALRTRARRLFDESQVLKTRARDRLKWLKTGPGVTALSPPQ